MAAANNPSHGKPLLWQSDTRLTLTGKRPPVTRFAPYLTPVDSVPPGRDDAG